MPALVQELGPVPELAQERVLVLALGSASVLESVQPAVVTLAVVVLPVVPLVVAAVVPLVAVAAVPLVAAAVVAVAPLVATAVLLLDQTPAVADRAVVAAAAVVIGMEEAAVARVAGMFLLLERCLRSEIRTDGRKRIANPRGVLGLFINASLT